jgi:peptidyl-prolyl cis-trans isomerase A (cyclophilin A)
MTQLKAFTDTTVTKGSTSYYNLAAFNLSPDTTNTTVTFNTSKGAIDVTLLDSAAPVSVTNFLSYVQNNAYTNDLFHRMANLNPQASNSPPYQILQGGQFTTNSSNGTTVSSFTNVATYPAIQNEFDPSRPNSIGSLAMARTSDLDSATSQFYFNLTDNTNTLGQTGNGYAVFGNVANSASLANLQSFASSYTPQAATINTVPNASMPALNGANPAVPTDPVGTSLTNLAIINSITGANPTGYLNYLVSSSDPSIVTATIGSISGPFSPSQIQLIAGQNAGTAVITVTLIDNRNEATIKTFNVTVS